MLKSVHHSLHLLAPFFWSLEYIVATACAGSREPLILILGNIIALVHQVPRFPK